MATHYANPILVVIGTTLGMLLADVPAVFIGNKLASRIPMKLVRGHLRRAGRCDASGCGIGLRVLK
jgi:putative Ca2+/H+ antiporter (TMEM165/GDT1 family)